MLKSLAKKRKGFTLIELIVVIAILAILAAILIPSMLSYINDSKKSVGEANARTVYSAASSACTYLEANGGTVASISTAVDVATAKAGSDAFAKKIAENLGDTFKGQFTVTYSGGAVTSVTWQENATSDAFTYPQGTTTTTVAG